MELVADAVKRGLVLRPEQLEPVVQLVLAAMAQMVAYATTEAEQVMAKHPHPAAQEAVKKIVEAMCSTMAFPDQEQEERDARKVAIFTRRGRS